MPSANFFTQLGLFVVKNFFDEKLCLKLRSEMHSGKYTPAAVIDGQSYLETRKESVRRTNYVEVPKSTRSEVEAQLLNVKPLIEHHFNLPLSNYEKPQFLVYHEGDFFLPHQDKDDNACKPEYIQRRQVSVVIFLNQAKDNDSESYHGGTLTFYGLINDPRWEHCGFPLESERGLLVAFRSEVLHEVTTVTQGARYTVVDWFF